MLFQGLDCRMCASLATQDELDLIAPVEDIRRQQAELCTGGCLDKIVIIGVPDSLMSGRVWYSLTIA
jgi:hypothetical protein